jgi:sec-independent protein translocase protein TatB
MFDIGWSELLLIAVVALIAIGPKELPGALRTLGQWMGKLRRMASEFQGQFHEAMREAEMADLKKQVDEMTSQAQSYANFDPVGDIRKEFESTQQQIEGAIADPPPRETSTPAAAEAQLPDAHTASAPAPSGAEPAIAPSTDADTAAPSSVPSERAPAGSAAEPARQDAGGKPA